MARAATVVMMYLCKKNPRSCKDMAKCILNPASCKKRFCKKKPNRSYHGDDGKSGVCDVPGCEPSDAPAEAQFKKAAAEMCVLMREFVSYVCFNGKMDANHKREYDEAKEKVKNCEGRCLF
jgi:hypothetical protein